MTKTPSFNEIKEKFEEITERLTNAEKEMNEYTNALNAMSRKEVVNECEKIGFDYLEISKRAGTKKMIATLNAYKMDHIRRLRMCLVSLRGQSRLAKNEI